MSNLSNMELNETMTLWRKAWGETIFQWENILGDFENKFQKGWERQINLRAAKADGYNIFEITNRAHYEVTTHSAFLSHLLDPLESHDQGDLFLNAFLKLLKKKKNLEFPSSKSLWEIECENSFSLEMDEEDIEDELIDGGRLDILLRCLEDPGFAIIIENKIYASDQLGQITRYWRQIQRLAPKEKRLLIYLTPGGSKPSKDSFKGLTPGERHELEKELICLSYQKDISHMLNSLLEDVKASVVKETIQQYIRTLGVL